MKARDYLVLLIEENPTDEHSAALRELDQLLSDMVAQAKYLQLIESEIGWVGFDELLVRAAQAGYGEK